MVPAGMYFMMGDNRDNSRDSRYIGFVAEDQIVGRTSEVVMSLDYNNYYRNLPDIVTLKREAIARKA